jgi:hypothetical protein
MNSLGTVDGSTKKGFSAMEVFCTPRIEGEKDLVGLIVRDLEAYYCKLAKDVFISNRDIISIIPLNPISQRVIINRWFNAELLKYRSRVDDLDVVTVLRYVIDDGTIDDWLESMQVIVIPFFKLKNILNLPLGE